MRKLRKLAASDELGASQHALLVTSIDWYAGIRRKSGETASRGLVSTAARAIKRAVGDERHRRPTSATAASPRCSSGNRPPPPRVVAETLAKDFGSRESHHESIPRPTLTSAVVPWTAGSNADQFLNEALETLDLAVHSGGDCVVLHGEFNKELAAWQEEMATGNPFANVVAQDIMEPFPALLEQDADQSELAESLRRAGIPVRPYVDREGRLVGVAADDEAAAETRIGQAGGRGQRAARQAGNDLLRRQLPRNLRSLLLARLLDARRHRRRPSARLSHLRRLPVDDRPDPRRVVRRNRQAGRRAGLSRRAVGDRPHQRDRCSRPTSRS